jgi:hypothetical protein
MSITITQAALHAALRRVRDDGSYISLDVLLTLLDPAHRTPPPTTAPGAPPALLRDDSNADVPRQDPNSATHEPPAESADHADGSAPPAPAQPSPAPGGEHHPAPRQAADTTPGKWTEARMAMLRVELPACTDRPGLLARINALPGLPIASVKALLVKASSAGIRSEAWVPRAIETAAGQQGGRKSVLVGQATRPSEVRTAERWAAFPALWQDVSLSVQTIQARLNAMPGKPISSSTQLYAWAEKAGLPTQRGAPPPPIAAPVAAGDEKAEVFEAFSAGQTVRDVHADLGLPLSTLSNWHAEWRLPGRKDTAP